MILENCQTINVVLNCNKSGIETYLIPFSVEKNMRYFIFTKILPILEEWAKVKLDGKNGIMYGIRRYTRGAILLQHTDRLPTHIISAILQVHTSAWISKKF